LIKILELKDNGNYTQQQLAGIFEIKQQMISFIINNKSWKGIK